jgi:dTDP-4-dehydrorhamnose reductase
MIEHVADRPATTCATRSTRPRSARSAGRPAHPSRRRWTPPSRGTATHEDWWRPLKDRRVDRRGDAVRRGRERDRGSSSPAPAASSAATSSTPSPTTRWSALTHAELDVTDEAAVAAAVRDLAPTWSSTPPPGPTSTAARPTRTGPTGSTRSGRGGSPGPAARRRHAGARLDRLRLRRRPAPRDVRRPGASRAAWTEFDPVAPSTSTAAPRPPASSWSARPCPSTTSCAPPGCAARGAATSCARCCGSAASAARRVVDDQVGSPTFAADLAPAMRELAVAAGTGPGTAPTPAVQSWFDLAAATFELAGLDVDLAPQPSSALDRPPAAGWSVLDTRHARLSRVPRCRTGATGSPACSTSSASSPATVTHRPAP